MAECILKLIPPSPKCDQLQLRAPNTVGVAVAESFVSIAWEIELMINYSDCFMWASFLRILTSTQKPPKYIFVHNEFIVQYF